MDGLVSSLASTLVLNLLTKHSWLVHDGGDGYNEIDIIENISLNNQNWMNAYVKLGIPIVGSYIFTDTHTIDTPT